MRRLILVLFFGLVAYPIIGFFTKRVRAFTPINYLLLLLPVILGGVFLGDTFLERYRWPSPKGSIVYVSAQNVGSRLYVVDPITMNQRELPVNEIEAISKPTWSTGRGSIAFQSNSLGESRIMSLDYYNLRLDSLISCDCDDYVFSPLSEEISALSMWDDQTKDWDVVVLDENSRDLVCPTYENDFAPSWSPDGKSLVFVSDRDGSYQLYLCELESGQARKLTKAGSNFNPSWSPNGGTIAYASMRDGYSEIYTIPVDGSKEQAITHLMTVSDHPSWSPTGEQLVFQSDLDGDYELLIVDLDDLEIRSVTSNDNDDLYPSWLQ